MDPQPNVIRRTLDRLVGDLRFPQLFLLVGALFVLDVLIPDFIPLVDEIILGLLTLMLGTWKNRKGPRPAAPPPTGAGPSGSPSRDSRT